MPEELGELQQRLTGNMPASRIKAVTVRRHPSSVVEPLNAIPDLTATVADALDDLGVGAVLGTDALQPLDAGMRVCGPAVTLRYVPVNGQPSQIRSSDRSHVLADRDLYGIAQAGDVGVIDAGSDRAVMGGLSAAWAAKAGLAGCLVNGSVRDSATIIKTGLPVWSSHRFPGSARYRVDAISINDTITLAGAVVRPGDYVMADSDGVCVVPYEDLPTVVEACVIAQKAEDSLTETINSSNTLEDLIKRTRSAQTTD